MTTHNSRSRYGRTAAIGAATTAALLTLGTTAFSADETVPDSAPPPPPEWIDPDTGLVDPDAYPDCMPMADQTGQIVRDAQGQPECAPGLSNRPGHAGPPDQPGEQGNDQRNERADSGIERRNDTFPATPR